MNTDTAIKGILEWRERIYQNDYWSDPMGLSEAMVKLSVYNSYLADEIAPAHKNATDTAYHIFSEHKDEGVTKAEQLAKGESTQERMYFENIKNIYGATDKLIGVIQSRLRVLENQLKREGQ